MGKEAVLQTIHEKSFKLLIGNGCNKMKSLRSTRRRQRTAFNTRQSVVPLANVLILLHLNAKNWSGFWSGNGSGYVAVATCTLRKQC